MYKLTKLPSGLQVATCRLPNAKSAAVGLWVRVGGRYEPSSINGISHFFEHMVFKGTKKRSYRQIKEAIEGSGGILNGFTSEEVTCYLAKVLKKNLPIAMDVLLEMLLFPLIKETDIQKERLVIFEEIKMYYDLPQHHAYDILQKMLWPDSALGRNLAGNEKTLSTINREHLLKFKKRFYNLNNMLLCVCADVEHDDVVKNAKNILKKNIKRNAPNSKIIKYHTYNFKQKKPQVSIYSKRTQQIHIALGAHSLKREHRLRYALVLLHIVLGANMSSRLFNEVREKYGYAYEISTSLKRFDDTGAFIVHAGIVKEKLDHACELILKQLKNLTSKNVNISELKRAKEYFSGQMLMSLDDALDRMGWIGEKLINKRKVPSIDEVLNKVELVTPDHIKEVAKMIFKKGNYNLSVVGPVDQSKKTKLNSILRGF